MASDTKYSSHFAVLLLHYTADETGGLGGHHNLALLKAYHILASNSIYSTHTLSHDFQADWSLPNTHWQQQQN